MAERRRLLQAAAATAALASLAALRPRDRGRPHPPYFVTLQQGLREAGIAWPVLLVDQDRLQRNLARIGRSTARRGLPLRVVVKSLPALALIDSCCAAWQTDRAMVFNAVQLLQVGRARPRLRLLLGKPLPAAAARRAMEALASAGEPEPGRRIEWLVDTPERLQQYRELARALGVPLALNIEIDVGLHRGGAETPAQLAAMLQALQAEPLLRWAGLMGYDAHVTALPDLPGVRDAAQRATQRRWQALWQEARQLAPAAAHDRLTLNTGGSRTFHLHGRDGLPNEVAVGSAALKPSDFDTPTLADLEAAAFIAAPVLKDLGRFRLPEGAGWLSTVARAWDPNRSRGYAIHGGRWLADPVSPAGMEASRLFGPSSNQQVMAGSSRLGLQADDFVFWRPRQSEAVLLQFGELVFVSQGRVVGTQAMLPASA
ncbi:alanine racemase [Aquabacterium sp. A7-Y]|uniref:alanine racemase n=1 Tax=Aquabacterium sp. A7-Y TaxID=1349605 RepID=UPI00223CFFCC|nr:alanine racemase [Aquabacterium sp. A7-Y]MCW7537881.1 alanine racemase [Aquabacterium sp. A7-Y]